MNMIVFVKCESDHCVYVKWDDEDMVFVVLWIYNLIIASSNDEFLTSIKYAFSDRFETADLIELRYFVGVEIKSDHAAGHMTMRRTKFFKSVLTKFGIHDSKPVKKPQDHVLKLT